MSKIGLIDMSSVKPTADDYLKSYNKLRKSHDEDGLDKLLDIVNVRLYSLIKRFENDFLNTETYDRKIREYSHDVFIKNVRDFICDRNILSIYEIPSIIEHIKICEDIFCEVYYGEQTKMEF